MQGLEDVPWEETMLLNPYPPSELDVCTSSIYSFASFWAHRVIVRWTLVRKMFAPLCRTLATAACSHVRCQWSKLSKRRMQETLASYPLSRTGPESHWQESDQINVLEKQKICLP